LNILTRKESIKWAIHELGQSGLYFGHGPHNARDEAVWALLNVLNKSNGETVRNLDKEMSRDEQARFNDIIQKRTETRQPLAYLLNEAWFAGLKFYVNPDVLVPRSPLAEIILDKFTPWLKINSDANILELCTGSGCIAISIATHLPQSRVTASDISGKALKVAERNLEIHDLAGRIQLYNSDLYKNIPREKYDLIISNPPYVSLNEYNQLQDEYMHEPRIGLTDEGDGLVLVEEIILGSADRLNENGYLVVEVGNTEAIVKSKWPNIPFQWIHFSNSLSGVFILTYEQVKQLKTPLSAI